MFNSGEQVGKLFNVVGCVLVHNSLFLKQASLIKNNTTPCVCPVAPPRPEKMMPFIRQVFFSRRR